MKRVKKICLLGVSLFFTCVFANAQNATADLTVTLASVLDIHIGTATGTSTTVAMPSFNNADAYQNGVQSVQDDHLYIIASKGFTIQVSSTDLTSGASPDADHTISAAGINVLGADGTQGSTAKPAGTAYTSVDLANTAANFIVATGGTQLYKYKVTYTLGGGSRASNFIGKSDGNYSATVTYTIIP